MINRVLLLAGLTLVASARPVDAQDTPSARSISEVAAAADERLQASLAELSALRDAIAAEKVPMAEELAALERQLHEARQESQRVSRDLDGRTLDLSTLSSELKRRQDEIDYLSNNIEEYRRNFGARIHITEMKRYASVLDAAQLALDNPNLPKDDVFRAQVKVVETSLDRLEDALGGTKFAGSAVDETGLVNEGTVVLVGPVAIFASAGGNVVGTAEQRMSSEPIVVPFADPLDAEAAGNLAKNGGGLFPFDATLGNAHRMQAVTQETFLEHIKKGGPVMYPIFAMAAAALLVALLKWVSLTLLRKPSRKSVQALLDAVGRQDETAAQKYGSAVSERGPIGRMLWAGVQHMREPRELVEESMYETVLVTKHRLNSFLPFIAICAASAPLLGLLGTVTGIINTFKLITVFGSGDVKSLSGGISEALITTKWGLIVAIPSLLLHAFLSRKARGVVARMEATAVAFVNRLAKSSPEDRQTDLPANSDGPDPDLVRAHVTKILGELLEPLEEGSGGRGRSMQHS